MSTSLECQCLPNRNVSTTCNLAWLLAFKKSGRKQLNQLRDRHYHANDFVNAKSHAKEKPQLAGYVST